MNPLQQLREMFLRGEIVHKAISGDLPKVGQRVLIWFEHTGYSIETYSRSEYPAGVVAEEAVPCNVFHSKSGYLTDEDVYWVPLPESSTSADSGAGDVKETTPQKANIMTKDEKISVLKELLSQVSPSGAAADMLDDVVAPGSATHKSGSPKCYCCGSENVIIECGSCKERRVFGTWLKQ